MTHSSLKPLVYYISMDFHPDLMRAARANDIVKCLSELAKVKVVTNNMAVQLVKKSFIPACQKFTKSKITKRLLREFFFARFMVAFF